MAVIDTNLPSDLNLDFFQTILRRSDNEPTLVVEKINWEPACKAGDNYMSLVKRVFIEGYVEKASVKQAYKTQLFVKLPLPSTELKLGPDVNFNEPNTYKAVDALQSAINDQLHFPKSIYLSETLVILEDLKVSGYELADRRRNFTIDEMNSVIQILSKFHASSLILKLRDRNRFDAISENLIEHLFEKNPTPIVRESISDAFKLARLRIERYWNDECKKMATGFLTGESEQSNALFSATKTAVLKTSDEAVVIGHCDCWFNNIMLRKNENVESMLVDLQTMVKTSFARDLITLITTNPSLNKNRLIEIYTQQLQKYLQQYGADMQTIKKYDYTFVKTEVQRLRNYELIVGLWLAVPICFTTQPTKDDFLDESRRFDVYVTKFLGQYYDQQVYGVLKNFYENL